MGLLGQRLEHFGKREAPAKRNKAKQNPTYFQVKKWLMGPVGKRDKAKTAIVKTPLRKIGLGTPWEETEKWLRATFSVGREEKEGKAVEGCAQKHRLREKFMSIHFRRKPNNRVPIKR